MVRETKRGDGFTVSGGGWMFCFRASLYTTRDSNTTQHNSSDNTHMEVSLIMTKLFVSMNLTEIRMRAGTRQLVTKELSAAVIA